MNNLGMAVQTKLSGGNQNVSSGGKSIATEVYSGVSKLFILEVKLLQHKFLMVALLIFLEGWFPMHRLTRKGN